MITKIDTSAINLTGTQTESKGSGGAILGFLLFAAVVGGLIYYATTKDDKKEKDATEPQQN